MCLLQSDSCVEKEVIILLNIKISGDALAINCYILPQTPDILGCTHIAAIDILPGSMYMDE